MNYIGIIVKYPQNIRPRGNQKKKKSMKNEGDMGEKYLLLGTFGNTGERIIPQQLQKGAMQPILIRSFNKVFVIYGEIYFMTVIHAHHRITFKDIDVGNPL